MATDGDNSFEPRPGRPRHDDSPHGRRYLHRVLASAARSGPGPASGRRRFTGGRIGRGTVAARLLAGRPDAGRRAIVKTRLVRISGRGIGAMRAHLRYLERDGAAADADARGRLYGPASDHVDGPAFIECCAGDRHQFRLILSPEDGNRYDDLRPLVRRFIGRMESDLGTALDWVAVDHADTPHPHSHVILRGRDDQGGNLVIAPDYIARGMRERLAELVTLDLGPRSELERLAQQRLEIDSERMTPLDRRLLQDSDPLGQVDAAGRDAADRALRTGRLRKLERLGLAQPLDGGRWALKEGLEPSLRAIGERGDIIRTLQRALTRAGIVRAAADQLIYDPGLGKPLVGRVVDRGLADELGDRHFLIVDGIDGRTHYVGLGAGEAVQPVAAGAVVEIVPAPTGIRPSDRTIAAIAAAHGGQYSEGFHRDHDPSATTDFIAAHVRRLEALRRPLGLQRSGDGVWTVRPDHLERVADREMRSAARPIEMTLLSPVAVDQLAAREGATWLDRQLAAGEPAPVRDAGFGRDLARALAARCDWLEAEGLGVREGERFRLRRGALALLLRRELLGEAGRIGAGTGKPYVEAVPGTRVAGIVRRRLDLASGSFALVENEQSFSLVPWRPVHGWALGREIAGTIHPRVTNWTLRRGRER